MSFYERLQDMQFTDIFLAKPIPRNFFKLGVCIVVNISLLRSYSLKIKEQISSKECLTFFYVIILFKEKSRMGQLDKWQ